MRFKSFLKLVEIQTKVASMTPFALGSIYTLYRYKEFKLINFLLMFISLLTFDMATTVINNYYDYKKASDEHDYKKENVIGKDNISIIAVRTVLGVLLTIAVAFGIILTLRTDIVVLLIGIISFVTGILYTFGPIPLSRMPLGEAFSGFFMGFIILFLSVYIHIFDREIVAVTYANKFLGVNVNIVEVLSIFLISIPVVNGIANIMLANNICDVEQDIINRRFTLPYYIGRKNALILFRTLYYMGYIAIILSVCLGIEPIAMLLALLTFIPVNKNINTFVKRHVKNETFVISVKNLIIANVPPVLIIAVVALINSLR